MDERPLPERLRPADLDGFVGQEHLVSPTKPLGKLIASGQVHSMILWGPPGTGKTTLARIIAKASGRKYFELSAVSAGKDELRQIVEKPMAKASLFDQVEDVGKPPVLFLDEIHRFNKAQQDFLLPHVESGKLVLIGATTENPSFEVNPALLSRAVVYVLRQLTPEQLRSLLQRGLDQRQATADPKALEAIIQVSGGDARQALNTLQNALDLFGTELKEEQIAETLKEAPLKYSRTDDHYNTISALIKSMRASHPTAALHYLARMIKAGDDPKFIARRMVIFASEDIGLASPRALEFANATFRAVETVGYPECSLTLAHCAVALSLAPKSRAVTYALEAAMADVEKYPQAEIPLKLRQASTRLMKDLGYGEGYKMRDQEGLLPKEIEGASYLNWPPKEGEG